MNKEGKGMRERERVSKQVNKIEDMRERELW